MDENTTVNLPCARDDARMGSHRQNALLPCTLEASRQLSHKENWGEFGLRLGALALVRILSVECQAAPIKERSRAN
jgi:hypothetical protein